MEKKCENCLYYELEYLCDDIEEGSYSQWVCVFKEDFSVCKDANDICENFKYKLERKDD